MGKSLLMIHGFGCGGDVWDRMRKSFEDDGWRCEAPTLFQHLRSIDSPPEEISSLALRDYVQAASDYAEQLFLEEGQRPAVIGHSMGGLIAQNLAARDLVSAAILLTPAGPDGTQTTALAPLITFANIILQPAAKRLRSGLKIWRRGFYWGVVNCVPQPHRAAIYDKARHESGLVMSELLNLPDAADGVGVVDEKSVHVPTLTIGAGQDRTTPVAGVRKVAQKYAHAATPGEYKEYPDNGHWILDEPGSDEVFSDIKNWLEKRSTETPTKA